MLRVQRVVVYGSSSSSRILLTLCPILVAARLCCSGRVCSWAFQYRITCCSPVSPAGFNSFSQIRPAHVLWCWRKVRSEFLIWSVGGLVSKWRLSWGMVIPMRGGPLVFLVGNFSSYLQVLKNSTLLASFSAVSSIGLVGFRGSGCCSSGMLSYSSLPSRLQVLQCQWRWKTRGDRHELATSVMAWDVPVIEEMRWTPPSRGYHQR